MNHSKIAAALHALADAFLADVESVEQAVTGKKGGKKAAAVDPSPAAAATAPAASQASAPADTASAAAVVAPAAPSVTKDQLNKLVLKVAAKNREAAMAILGKFGRTSTVPMPPEEWQPAYDAFEEELAKIDAAEVQVANASLV